MSRKDLRPALRISWSSFCKRLVAAIAVPITIVRPKVENVTYDSLILDRKIPPTSIGLLKKGKCALFEVTEQLAILGFKKRLLVSCEFP